MVGGETVDCLLKVGEWTKRCGEALYGAEASPFPLSFPWGGITMKANRMYLLVTDAETREITLGGILSRPQSARLLGYPETKVGMSWSDGVLKVDLPEDPEPYVPVIEIVFDAKPELNTRLGQLPDGSIILPAYLSQLDIQDASMMDTDIDSLPQDKRVEFESRKKLCGDKRPHPWSMQIEPGGFVQNWKSTANSILWEFGLDQPGEFEVWVSSVSAKYVPWEGGHRVRVESGDSSCEGELVEEVAIQSPRSKYYPENACRIGALELKKTGPVSLRLQALEICPDRPEGLAVTEIVLREAL